MSIPHASLSMAAFLFCGTGGGFGMLARKYGLASDRLIGVQMVDAAGNIVTANKTVNADLLWACQGGGGGEFAMAHACPLGRL